MKLLFCLNCEDVMNLNLKEKSCSCGESGGKYIDNLNAIYWGDCKPLGFINSDFKTALVHQPNQGEGKRFVSFVIPKRCPTMKRINRR